MAATWKLSGETELPGDKSISHRAVLLGGLSSGTSLIQGLSDAADPASTVACMRSLGVLLDVSGTSARILGKGLKGLRRPPGPLDCGNSGTTMRLLAGVLAGQPFDSRLVGDASLMQRPMERVADPLRQMGADVRLNERGSAPMEIRGHVPLRPLRYVAQFPSAQVKSAILLAGLYAYGETEVVEPVPTRDHTERMLGLSVRESAEGRTIRVNSDHAVEPFEMRIPGDVSAAVFLIAAAALVPGSQILIKNVGINPGRVRVLSLLRSWGVSLAETNIQHQGAEPVADVSIHAGLGGSDLQISPEDVPLLIDEIPALACLALAAGVGCSVRGASELRAKETDRISQLVRNFRLLGVETEQYPDGFSFGGKRDLRPATIVTGGDHRVAMAFSVASLVHPGIVIDDRECVGVSFPEFFSTLNRLGAPL